MKKIFNLLIGLVLISTGAYAADKEAMVTEFESALLLRHVMDVFIEAAVATETPANGSSCFSILPLSFDYDEEDCSALSEQTEGKLTCEDVKKSIDKISQMDCRFAKNADSLTISFSDMPSDIDAVISEKMATVSTLSPISYKNGTFTNNLSLYGGE